jgi:hypothetical protein
LGPPQAQRIDRQDPKQLEQKHQQEGMEETIANDVSQGPPPGQTHQGLPQTPGGTGR